MRILQKLTAKQIDILLRHWGWDRVRIRSGYPSQNSFQALKEYGDTSVVASLQQTFKSRALIHHIPEVFVLLQQAMERLRTQSGGYTARCMAIIETYYVHGYGEKKKTIAQQLGIGESTLREQLKDARELLRLYINESNDCAQLRKYLR